MFQESKDFFKFADNYTNSATSLDEYELIIDKLQLAYRKWAEGKGTKFSSYAHKAVSYGKMTYNTYRNAKIRKGLSISDFDEVLEDRTSSDPRDSLSGTYVDSITSSVLVSDPQSVDDYDPLKLALDVLENSHKKFVINDDEYDIARMFVLGENKNTIAKVKRTTPSNIAHIYNKVKRKLYEYNQIES